MNKKSNIHFGPGAPSLILIFVVLSMSILGMLALINGRSDAQLSRRSAQVIEAVYRLSEQAELRRAELTRRCCLRRSACRTARCAGRRRTACARWTAPCPSCPARARPGCGMI